MTEPPHIAQKDGARRLAVTTELIAHPGHPSGSPHRAHFGLWQTMGSTSTT